jgi:release factor glutamine methyltransferase
MWALLERASGWRRERILTHDDALVDTGAAALFLRWSVQRHEGMPLSYLTGDREFYGRQFWVNRHTLIPRSETELLIDILRSRLPAGPPHHAADNRGWQLCDMGTGSGCIAVTLALEFPNAQVHAVDRSEGALQMAAHNAAWLGVSARVHLHRGDWWRALPDTTPRFHAIASNPPYVAAGDPHLERGDLRYEPMLALSGEVHRAAVHAGTGDTACHSATAESAYPADSCGLAHILRIVAQAPEWLLPGGLLAIEHGFDQQAQVMAAFERSGLTGVEGVRDLAGQPRVVLGWRSAE